MGKWYGRKWWLMSLVETIWRKIGMRWTHPLPLAPPSSSPITLESSIKSLKGRRRANWGGASLGSSVFSTPIYSHSPSPVRFHSEPGVQNGSPSCFSHQRLSKPVKYAWASLKLFWVKQKRFLQKGKSPAHSLFSSQSWVLVLDTWTR